MRTKDEVRAAIEKFFKAMDTQNLSLMKRLLPEEENMVHIGTDEDEIWKGWKSLIDATRSQFEKLQFYKAHIYDLSINLSHSGDVAWYFHHLDARIQSGDTLTEWEKARFTGVLKKRKGQWKLIQTHVSIPESRSTAN